MKQFAKGLVVLFVTFCLTSSVMGKEKVDPSGTWRWEYDMNGETRKDALAINLGKDGKLDGKYIGTNRTEKIKEGKLEKDQVKVKIELDFQGTPLELVFAGKVDGDKIDGTVTGDYDGNPFEFPWKPTRSVHNGDVVGHWQFTIDAQGNTLKPEMKISKDGEKLKAKYTAQSGDELEVSNLKVEKNSLVFTVKAEVNGSQLKASYKGRPYGNKISGKLEYDYDGNSGELDFTGERKAEKKKKSKEKSKEAKKE